MDGDGQQTLAPLVAHLRKEAGLSQRAFGRRVGTSGPAVAAYEAGSKEPRWSTVVRMAEVIGLEVEVDVRASDPGAAQRERRSRRRRALAAAAAVAITADWPAALRLARQNLQRMRSEAPPSAQRWVETWAEVLEAGPEGVRRQLLAVGDSADDIRQMSPFAGILSEAERRAALAAADAVA